MLKGIRDNLGRTEFAILDLGCGPMNIERMLAEQADASTCFRFFGLDIDAGAIAHANARIHGQRHEVEIRRCNLLGPDGLQHIKELAPRVDACLCMGFFDYLDPETIAVFLAQVREQVRPGTPILFANYLPDHPARSAMEWYLDWWLVYKTEAEMRRIAEYAGFQPGSIDTRVDASRSVVLVKAVA